MRRGIGILALACLWAWAAPPGHGQDIQLSQYYNVSPLINPAFAGTTYAFRGIVNSRIQWNELDASFHTHIVSVDYNMHDYNSGIGLYVLHDEQGQGAINRNEVALQYAYSVEISPKVSLRLALQGSYNQRRVGTRFRFPSQFNGEGFDPNIPTIDQVAFDNVNYLDATSGLLVYTKRFWGGFSMGHLNRPNQSLILADDRLEHSYSFIMGYKFVLMEIPTMRYLSSSNIEKLTLTPTFHYKTQGKSDQVDLGLYGMYRMAMLGLWYRGIPTKDAAGDEANNESIIFLLGMRLDQFSVSYSFDNVVSSLAGTAGDAHEFNLIYQFPKTRKKRKKPMKMLPCPSFDFKDFN